MNGVILEIIDGFGYWGILFLIMIENIFPPIPSEVILTFGGFLTTYTNLKLWGVIMAATLGSVAGAIILYSLGRMMTAERLAKLLDSSLAKLLQLKKQDVMTAQSWFVKHGNKAVLLCRCVPVVRSLISLPAGMAKMPIIPFLSSTIIGTFIWNLVLVFLGRAAGNAWEVIAGYLDIYSMIAFVVFGLIAIISIKKRRGKY